MRWRAWNFLQGRGAGSYWNSRRSLPRLPSPERLSKDPDKDMRRPTPQTRQNKLAVCRSMVEGVVALRWWTLLRCRTKRDFNAGLGRGEMQGGGTSRRCRALILESKAWNERVWRRLRASDALDIFYRVTRAIANAEKTLRFEHRELHISNICIKRLPNPLSQTPDEAEVTEATAHVEGFAELQVLNSRVILHWKDSRCFQDIRQEAVLDGISWSEWAT